MQDYILQRVMEIAEYIMETGFTVRQTAQVFGVSKSTVHKDVTERLPQINANLAGNVRKILERNKAERHLRGGEATRRKYLSQRQQSEQAEKVGADEITASEENAVEDKNTLEEKNAAEN